MATVLNAHWQYCFTLIKDTDVYAYVCLGIYILWYFTTPLGGWQLKGGEEAVIPTPLWPA